MTGEICMNIYRKFYLKSSLALVVSCLLATSLFTNVQATQNNTFAYIPNYNDNSVSVISLASNSVISTIPVGNNPFGVAAGPGYVYVTDQGDDYVTVINTHTNNVSGSIKLDSQPIATAV